MERIEGLVSRKDLEVIAALRVFSTDRLVAYDRHFGELREYGTPKRMVEEFHVRPDSSQY